MGAGISVALALAALALVPLTFRGGVEFYKKLLAWLVLAALVYFYQNDILLAFKQIAAGDYKTAPREFNNLIQVSLPALVFALVILSFIVSSAADAGKILILLAIIFTISTAIKLALLA